MYVVLLHFLMLSIQSPSFSFWNSGAGQDKVPRASSPIWHLYLSPNTSSWGSHGHPSAQPFSMALPRSCHAAARLSWPQEHPRQQAGMWASQFCYPLMLTPIAQGHIRLSFWVCFYPLVADAVGKKLLNVSDISLNLADWQLLQTKGVCRLGNLSSRGQERKRRKGRRRDGRERKETFSLKQTERKKKS